MKRIYTVVTAEGREKILGAFENEKAATASFVRRLPADLRGLCSNPIAQRAVRPGETIIPGALWSPAVQDET